MSTQESINNTPTKPVLFQFWCDYYELCKPRVVALLVFTAIIGMFLATPGMVPLDVLFFGTLGIGLASASAAAINQVVDQKIDADMNRTRNRPLPSGNLTNKQALVFSIVLGAVAMFILVKWVNITTAVLTFLSLIGYAVIYTMYLKRATPQNIVIGGAAGAAPPVLGWTAVTGQVDPHSLLLFLIIFAWTPPHFWALALVKRKDYARARIPMFPVVYGEHETKRQIILYSIQLAALTILLPLVDLGSYFYLISAIALGGILIIFAWRLWVKGGNRAAWGMYRYSSMYLALIFAALIIDTLVL